MTQTFGQLILALSFFFCTTHAIAHVDFDMESQIQTLASHTKSTNYGSTIAGILPELEMRERQLYEYDMLEQVNISESIANNSDDMHKMSRAADLLQDGARADLQRALKDVVNMSHTMTLKEALQIVGARLADHPFHRLGFTVTKTSSNQVDGMFFSAGMYLNPWNIVAMLGDYVLPKGMIATLSTGLSIEISLIHEFEQKATKVCFTISRDRWSYGSNAIIKDTFVAMGPVNSGKRPGFAWGASLTANSKLLPEWWRGQMSAQVEFTFGKPLTFVAGSAMYCVDGIIGCDHQPSDVDDTPDQPSDVDDTPERPPTFEDFFQFWKDGTKKPLPKDDTHKPKTEPKDDTHKPKTEPKWNEFIQGFHPFVTYTACSDNL